MTNQVELDDLELNEEIDVESDNDTSPIRRNCIVTLTNDARLNIKESEISMSFERKTKNKNEEALEENFKNDGYFTRFSVLFRYVLNVCIKEHIWTKASRDFKELYDIITKAEKEVMAMGDRIQSTLVEVDKVDMRKLKLVSGFSEKVIKEMIELYNNR